jgi:hypothetical protein
VLVIPCGDLIKPPAGYVFVFAEPGQEFPKEVIYKIVKNYQKLLNNNEAWDKLALNLSIPAYEELLAKGK